MFNTFLIFKQYLDILSSDLLVCFKTDTNGMQPLWYDWSVGIANQIPGSGLLNLNLQLVWHEAGTQTTARFSLSQSMLIGNFFSSVVYYLNKDSKSLRVMKQHQSLLLCVE